MKRKLANWLKGYEEYTSKRESPPAFHKWVGISMVATVMGEKVAYARGSDKIFPHLYVVLVGPSGIQRKSGAIHTGIDLLKKAEVPGMLTFEDECTAAAFIKDVAEHAKEMGSHTRVLIGAPELITFMKSHHKDEMQDIVAVLTKLYDRRYPYEHRTKTRGKDVIDQGAVNMMGGTTEEWLRKMFPTSAVRGGFIQRCIFIREPKDAPMNKVPRPLMNAGPLRDALLEDIKQMSQLEGVVVPSPEAAEWYDAWYMGPLWKEIIHPNATPDTEGWYGRYHEFVEKLATVLAISEGNKMVIEVRHYEQALHLMQDVEFRQKGVLDAIHDTELDDIERRTLEFLWKKGGGATLTELTLAFARRGWTAKKYQIEVLQSMAHKGLVVEYLAPPSGKVGRRETGYMLKSRSPVPGSPTLAVGSTGVKPSTPHPGGSKTGGSTGSIPSGKPAVEPH